MSERLTSLQSEIKKLEEQIAIRSAENKRPVITEEMIVFYLQNMRFEDKQQLLDKLVQRVVVTKKDGNVDYNVTVMLNYTSTAACSNAFSCDLSKVREQAGMVGPVGFEPTTSRL